MENITNISGSKQEKYKALLPQLEALWSGEPDMIANMANTAAAIKQTFDFHWVGFYLVKGNELVLGPFQGPVACTRIGFGKGVCGAAWASRKTVLVPDVELFPGHIACSALSKSEIVVPVFSNRNGAAEILQTTDSTIAVLDIDSSELGDFDETDQFWLEEICRKLSV